VAKKRKKGLNLHERFVRVETAFGVRRPHMPGEGVIAADVMSSHFFSRHAGWRTIGDLIHAFPPEECQRYLVNAGYASM
jgi:hypothetical protein